MGWGGLGDDSCLGEVWRGHIRPIKAHIRPIKAHIPPDTSRPLTHPNPSTHLDPIIPIGQGTSTEALSVAGVPNTSGSWPLIRLDTGGIAPLGRARIVEPAGCD